MGRNMPVGETRRACLEPLEPRVLLSGDVFISEFMAVNDSTITDENGRYSDWIELHNPALVTVDVAGWYLTDNASNLTKWQLPAPTVISEDGYLTVFASNQDRRVSGSELHTNFKLDGGGEYLALVHPDGVTIANEFAPAYPPQVADISYGVDVQMQVDKLVAAGFPATVTVPADASDALDWTGGSEPFDDAGWPIVGPTGVGYDTDVVIVLGPEIKLVNLGVPAKAFIPLDDSLGTAWRGGSEPFDDSGWLTGSTGVGFDTGSTYDSMIALDVEGAMHNVNQTAYIRIPFQVDDLPALSTLILQMRNDDGFVAFINGQEVLSVRAPGALSWNSGATAAHQAGYTFDSYDLTAHLGAVVAGANVLAIHGLNYGLGDSDFLVMPRLKSRLRYFEYVYGGDIETDVVAEMKDVNASAYMRIPFTVAEGADYGTLALQRKYDDGFIAYINGVKVAERNAPGSPAWNSAATAEQLDDDALVFETIGVTDYTSALVEGDNILAIHALNTGAADTDLLALPELEGMNVLSTTHRYFATPTPDGANNLSFTGLVKDTKFSVDRGLFTDPFDVTITSATAGATIIYTLDGSKPSWTNGIQVLPADGDTPPTLTLSGIGNTTTLRAGAFKITWQPTDIDTQSYIFLADVLVQPTNPAGWPTNWNPSGGPADYEMEPGLHSDVDMT
ncbi:hypothetical protein LCGC14_1787700, partial [marine sediment metagenome]